MKIEFVDECTSTNQILIERNDKENVALVAFSQSLGRGRKGRTFFSPKDTGIYLSIFLHPDKTVAQAAGLTTMMAVAAAKAIEEVTNVSIDIKWVNDLYVKGRKVGGILTECSPVITDGKPSYVVVGIGVNVYEPSEGFPEDIKDRAGSILTNAISKGQDARKVLAERIIDRFMQYCEDFEPAQYIEEYRKRSFLIGKDVVILGGPRVNVLGIEDDFSLSVRHEDGHTESLSAGEVSLIL